MKKHIYSLLIVLSTISLASTVVVAKERASIRYGNEPVFLTVNELYSDSTNAQVVQEKKISKPVVKSLPQKVVAPKILEPAKTISQAPVKKLENDIVKMNVPFSNLELQTKDFETGDFEEVKPSVKVEKPKTKFEMPKLDIKLPKFKKGDSNKVIESNDAEVVSEVESIEPETIETKEDRVYVNTVQETSIVSENANEEADFEKKSTEELVENTGEDIFTLPKKQKSEKVKKIKKKKTTKRAKGSLTNFKKTHNIKKIEKEINSEEIFQKETENKIYLNRFKAFDDNDKEDVFYSSKDIVETEDGDLKMLLGNGREIDKLVEDIENCNPDDPQANTIKLTLRDCIAIALAKHPDILSAKLDTDISKSRIIQAWASYFPSLSAGLNYGYDYMREPQYHMGYSSAYFPTLSAGMLLFDFGKVKTDVDMVTSSYDASKYNLQDSINIIIYSVKSAYYDMLFAQKQVDIYEKTIEDFELQLRSAKKYFSIGKKPQIEVAMAEYNEGNARLNLVKVKNSLENAKVLLANTLGLPEFANFELIDELPKEDYSTELEKLLSDAFSIRPDLLSYEKNVEYSFLALRRARRNFAPDLTANGSMSHGGVDPMKTTNYRMSVDFSYSGLNLLQLKKEYDIARKSYEKSLVDYESYRHNVYLEVKQAYINLINSKDTVEQADLNVQQAKAQHYHATGRYNAGVSDAIEMKDAENTYLSAQLEYYQALLSYNLAVANLEKVVGRPVEVANKNL